MKQKLEMESSKQVDFKAANTPIFSEGKCCFRVAPTSNK